MGLISLHWDLDWPRGSGAWALRLPFSLGSQLTQGPAHPTELPITVRGAAPGNTKGTKPTCPHQLEKGCSLGTGRERFPGSNARFKSKVQESTQSAIFVLAWETLEDCVRHSRLLTGNVNIQPICSSVTTLVKTQWFFCPSGQVATLWTLNSLPLCSHGWHWVASWASKCRVTPGRPTDNEVSGNRYKGDFAN